MDPCAACHRRLCARDTHCKAAVVETFFGCGPRNAVAMAVKRDVSVDAITVAPRPTIPSLMIIVEDMLRNNRGWGEGLKMRKSVGGSRIARAILWDGIVVRAPPPVSRGALKCLNVTEMFGSRAGVRGSAVGSAVGSATKPPPPKPTRMLEVKAPGSVFGRRHEMIASLATPSSKETPAATSTTQKQMLVAAVGVKRRSSVRKVETMNAPATSTLSSASVAKRKISTKERDEEYEQAIFSQDDCCCCWSFECPAMRRQSTAFEWFGAGCARNTTAAATMKVEMKIGRAHV